MDAEDVKSFLDVRKIDDDLPVEASRTKQCRIENIRAVGRSYYDDAGVGGEAVHLNENLVESLLPFIVTAAKSASSGAAHRIKLINEENTGSVLPSGLEEITDTGSTHTDEHLNEVRTGGVEEVDARLTRNGSGKQGLTCSRRSHKEDALGNPGSDFNESFRVLEEINDFLKLVFAFLLSCHIGKGNLLILV